MDNFAFKVRDFALSEQSKTGMPLLKHTELATSVGKRLAKELKANGDVVEAGTYLMDCMLGQALKENRLSDHIQISADKAVKLMKDSNLSKEDQENIKHCVLEHHGVPKFYYLESEIVCNADCYRFVSIKGFTVAIRYLREMPFEDLIKLLENKVNEKWSALTLDVCKKELESEYTLIKNMLSKLKN